MGYIELIPGFEDVPLAVVSGSKCITLVNLRTKHSEPLIIINSTTAYGQQAFFFKKEDYGLSIHFSLKRIIENGNARHNWARMPLKPDFIETLKKHARLPFVNTNKSLDLI